MAKRGRRQPEENEDIRTRHTRRQRRKRRARRARRTVFLFLLLLILIGVVAFATPIFNIQSITISGNEKVSMENLTAASEMLKGQNLFKVRSSRLKEALSSEPYIKDIHIKKILYPPKLKITVVESKPAVCLQTDSGFALVNEDGKVLEIVAEKPYAMPEITGMGGACTVGQTFTADDAEKVETALSLIKLLTDEKLIDKVGSISMQSLTVISFSYDNRLDVICGTANDLAWKITLFREAIMSNRLPENSRGTMDLSASGKAIYTP